MILFSQSTKRSVEFMGPFYMMVMENADLRFEAKYS